MDDYDFSDYDFGGYEDYTDYYAPQDTVNQILNYEPSGDQATDIVYPDVYYQQGGEMSPDQQVYPDVYYQQDGNVPVDQQVYPDIYYQQDFGPSDQMSQEEINQILTGTGGADRYTFKPDYGAPKQDKIGFRAELDKSAPGYAIEAKTPYGVDEETGTGMQMPTAPSLTSMGGGQGLTLDIPAEYDSEGNLIPGTGGVLSEKGFVPSDAQRVLGDPKSFINNPTVTGKTQVTTDSIRNPITSPNTNDVKTFLKEVLTSTGGSGGKGGGGSGGGGSGGGGSGGGGYGVGKGGLDLMKLLPLLLAMMAANKQAPASMIPSLGASRSQLPYSPPRPGQPNVSYFTPVTYRAAGGGISALNRGGHLGDYSDGGRLLKGPGDGVSDSIPATIGGKQPARLADGEFVIPARIVSELGNGSTDAGARKLYAMMKRVEQTRKKGKHIAQDTKADKHLPA